MKTFILLIIATGSMYGKQPAITHIPGYSSKEACQSAGKEWGTGSTYYWQCITGP